MDIIENRAYHRLLLHFKGDLTLDAIETPADPDTTDAATLHYGIGAFALCSDDRVSARRYFEKAVSGNQWPAFGFIAAEVELHRMNTAAAPAPK
jgi:hypothetical protein